MPHSKPLVTALLALAVLSFPACDQRAPQAPQPQASTPDATAATTGSEMASPINRPKHAILDHEAFLALREQTASQGKVLVVDCWATWCDSCIKIFPLLHDAMKERGDDVRLISLCYDEGEDFVKQAGAFLSRHKAWEDAYLVKAGPEAKDALAFAASENWGGGALPAVFVYGKDGELAYEMLQTQGDPTDWVNRISTAVDEASR